MQRQASILEKAVLDRGRSIVRSLSSLEDAQHPYRVPLKNELLGMIGDFRKLVGLAERIAEVVPPYEARKWVHRLERILRCWENVHGGIERAAALVALGRVDGRFLLLATIANSANVCERLKLERVRGRFAGRVASAAFAEGLGLRDLSVVDPDVVALQYVSLVPQRAKEEPGALSNRPDTYHSGPEVLKEQEAFERCLERLCGGDELDRDEALIDVIRRHQHLLLARLIRSTSRLDTRIEDALDVLWRHAEIVLLEDYFFSSRRMKLSHLLAMAEAFPAAARFQRLLSLYHPPGDSYRPAAEAVAPFEGNGSEELEVVLRTLLIHPLREYRRYSHSLLEPAKYWSVISFPQAPVIALADIADRLAVQDTSDDYVKVFFDCTHRMLGKVRDEPQLRAVRRMINTFFSFDFFLEDNYFKKLLVLNEATERREKRLKIENPLFLRHLEAFKKEKDHVGSRKTRLPSSFTEVPLTVQRKLAREGHYLQLFIRHPRPKIALETVPFISTSAAAEAVLKVKATNPRVVAEICKKEELLTSYNARLALLSHPHTPLQASQKYIHGMRSVDLRKLAASHDINPQIRADIRRRLSGAELR